MNGHTRIGPPYCAPIPWCGRLFVGGYAMYASRCRSRELHDIKHFPRAPRTVTLKKGSSGFGFSIIGGENGDGIYVSFIVAGGPADICGELRRGDCIVAVNGVSLVRVGHDQAATVLKNSSDIAELVVQYDPERYYTLEAKAYEQLDCLPNAPEGQLRTAQNKTFHVRALFDYDPTKDSDLPCQGLAFKYGDILHLTNATDEEWWRATFAMPGREPLSGVVPSRQRVERKERARIRSVRFRVAAQQGAAIASKWSPLDLLKLRKGKQQQLPQQQQQPSATIASTSTMDDEAQEIIASYEEVVPLQLRHARPVILLGYVKDAICDRLVTEYPESFCCLSRNAVLLGLSSNCRLDDRETALSWYQSSSASTSAGNCTPLQDEDEASNGFDGVDAAAVRRAAASGRHCVLTTSARVISRLQVSGFYPISVFVRPLSMFQIIEFNPSMSRFQAKDEYEACLLLEREFGKQFTAIVEGDTVDCIFQSVVDVIQNHSGSVVWVPAVVQRRQAAAASPLCTSKGKLGRSSGRYSADASG